MWGMLTESAAIRKETAEVGGERTLPTQMSCMSDGDTRKSSDVDVGSLRSTPPRTVERRVAGGCSARPPFRARQRGVRIAWTMTASRGCGDWSAMVACDWREKVVRDQCVHK